MEGNADNDEACDSGWLDGSSVGLGCLMFGTDPMTFLEANKFCYKNSAHLVEILSEAQMDYMKVELQLRETMVGPRDYWGGGSDLNREGQWYWTHSLLPLEHFVWAEGEPNGGATENFLEFYYYKEYNGNDIIDDDDNFPICQKD